MAILPNASVARPIVSFASKHSEYSKGSSGGSVAVSACVCGCLCSCVAILLIIKANGKATPASAVMAYIKPSASVALKLRPKVLVYYTIALVRA